MRVKNKQLVIMCRSVLIVGFDANNVKGRKWCVLKTVAGN